METRTHNSQSSAEHHATKPDPLPVSRDGIIVAEGYGLRVYVRRGVLQIDDSEGPNGRRTQLVRGASRGARVVLLGRAGSISVEALKWMDEAAVGFALIDAAAGRVVASSSRLGANLPRLRRLQAVAPESASGLAVAKFLIGRKLLGQARVLAEYFPNATAAATQLALAIEGVRNASSISDVVRYEAAAAASYWDAWIGNVVLHFVRRDEAEVPAHWRAFPGRGSMLSGSPRLATCPLNALLSYCYALGELESRLGLLTLGLDASLGIIHVDQRSRDSLALDLLEAVRPEVDRYVVELVRARMFRKADFYETTRGTFRVGREIARTVADTLRQWRRAVAPSAEEVARIIAASSDRRITIATKLTADSRSAGRDQLRKRPRRKPATRVPPASRACRSCGVILDTSHRYCDACRPERRAEVLAVFQNSGPARLAELREQGIDPSRTEEARRKRGASIEDANLKSALWDLAHERPDSAIWSEEILPRIQGVSLRRLAETTGLSRHYCSRIRRGLQPHPRHWEALRALGERSEV